MKFTSVYLGFSQVALIATKIGREGSRKILFRCSMNDRINWETMIKKFRRVNAVLFAPELHYQ